MDPNSIDRIRTATFEVVRKGYDPRQVESFLSRLADWLETGGGDEARSQVVKRELERVGEKTASILASAEDTAQQLRGDAEREVAEMIGEAEEDAANARSEADAYAAETRSGADRYAARLRGDADDYAARTRSEADTYGEGTRSAADSDAARKLATAEQRAEELVETAESKAKRIVNDGVKRRREIEAVIADLVASRNSTIADANALAEKLLAAASAHTPKDGADRFAAPRELDPLARGEAGDAEEQQNGGGDSQVAAPSTEATRPVES